jgi:hypothetical protein
VGRYENDITINRSSVSTRFLPAHMETTHYGVLEMNIKCESHLLFHPFATYCNGPLPCSIFAQALCDFRALMILQLIVFDEAALVPIPARVPTSITSDDVFPIFIQLFEGSFSKSSHDELLHTGILLN